MVETGNHHSFIHGLGLSCWDLFLLLRAQWKQWSYLWVCSCWPRWKKIFRDLAEGSDPDADLGWVFFWDPLYIQFYGSRPQFSIDSSWHRPFQAWHKSTSRWIFAGAGLGSEISEEYCMVGKSFISPDTLRVFSKNLHTMIEHSDEQSH